MFLVAPLTSLPVILTLDPFLCKVGSEWELRNLSLHQNYRADQRLQYSRKHYFDIYYQSCGIRKNYEITLRNKSFLKIRWRFDDNLSIVRRCHKVDASIIQSAIKQSNWKRCFFEGKKSILLLADPFHIISATFYFTFKLLERIQIYIRSKKC